MLKLQPGEISEPFEIAGSLYIAKVIERTEAEPVSFEEARPFIEETLTERKHSALAADLQARLLRQANVMTYPKVLEAYRENVSQSADDDRERR